MAYQPTTSQQLVSAKLRAGTRAKVALLKKLYGTRSEYDVLKLIVDEHFAAHLDRLSALAQLLQIELPA
ncbi:hypothetical protein [Hymenobacter sp. CRA2]|uniref:hypothetical protein n=1 Tax=Hymenobacter sp. CRA2 TaxID=1955620 RepID=UPI00098F8BB2|nr:hypothetical protein [Hymenobacter sp. CRA2]OON69930.1 hypothetical protein B0919_04045 [Hymenobacter sp. CRA2]